MKTLLQEPARKTFTRSVEELFSLLKNQKNLKKQFICAIDLPNDMGCLLPITKMHLQQEHIINLLTTSRNKYKKAFPTQFVANKIRTKKWLQNQVINNPLRILLLCYGSDSSIIGHIGLVADHESSCLYLENVIRTATEYKGYMTYAVKALMHWAETTLFPKHFYLKVLQDNKQAITFYERIGFKQKSKIPLKKQFIANELHFIPTDVPDEVENHLLLMKYEEAKLGESKEILTSGPSISQKEMLYLSDATQNGWNHRAFDYIDLFEKSMCTYLDMPYTIATSSCHGAMHIALKALDIGPGDEVIVPDITWIATASVVTYVGATPVFADIDPNTFNMDPKSLEQKITPQTKAIMPVHMYGHPANMPVICSLAEKYNLYVVEDAAPSLGSYAYGQKTGTFGHFAAFSFHGAKLTVAGEGGALVCSDLNLYEKAKHIANQGREGKSFWISRIGLKYKMSNIQAALALAQLERVEDLIRKKKEIHNWYKQNLTNVKGITFIEEPFYANSCCWMNSIIIQSPYPLSRNALADYLHKHNIDTRNVFPKISSYPMFNHTDNPNASFVGEHGLNLPSGVCLTKSEVDHVCNVISSIA